MRNISLVLLVVVLGAAGAAPAGAQKPPLRAGVSVELVGTQFAVAMPEVDEADSLVVAVTQKGTVYLGVTPRTPAQLTEELTQELAGRTSRSVSVKADARARYSGVEAVLAALREAGVERPALLTSQAAPADTPAYALPKGLRVTTGAAPPAAIRVTARREAAGAVGLTIQGTPTESAQFRAGVVRAAQERAGRAVFLSPDPALNFGDVAHVIDVCLGAGMGVTLALPSR